MNASRPRNSQVAEPPRSTLLSNLLEQLGAVASSPSAMGMTLPTLSPKKFVARCDRFLKILSNVLGQEEYSPLFVVMEEKMYKDVIEHMLVAMNDITACARFPGDPMTMLAYVRTREWGRACGMHTNVEFFRVVVAAPPAPPTGAPPDILLQPPLDENLSVVVVDFTMLFNSALDSFHAAEGFGT